MEVLTSLILSILFYLQHSCAYARGSATISPNGTALVCDGDQLELTCNITGSQVEWTVFGVPENKTTAVRYGRRLLNSRTAEGPEDLMVNSVLFTFSRISPSPLITRLVTSPASSDINGTEVICQDKITRNSSSTIVNVISKDLAQEIQAIGNYSLFLGDDDGICVAVLLQWKDLNLLYHNITVVPDTLFDIRHDSISIKVIYHTLYNVSVVHMCSGQDIIPLCIGLYYSNCSDVLGTSSLTVLDCRNSQVLHTIENTDNSCSGVVTQVEHNTTGPDVTSKASTDSSVPNIAGAALGGIFGIIFFAVCAILCTVIVGTVLFKGRSKSSRKQVITMKTQDECSIVNASVELPFPNNEWMNNSEDAVKGIMYAEVGLQQKQNKQTGFLNLDDHIEYAQLKHQPDTVIDKQLQPLMENAPIDMCTPIDSLDVNLDSLLIQLRPQVTSKWFQFGQAAGIDKEILENFAKQCSPEDCIMEMLDYWLRYCREVPTWKDIAEILKKINLPKLAHDIEGVYRTGKLPVEVDINWMPQFQQDNLDTSEMPPPVPPKMMVQVSGDNDDADALGPNDYHHQMILKSDLDTPAPVLPPKPNKSIDVSVDLPARPPKPSFRSPINYQS